MGDAEGDECHRLVVEVAHVKANGPNGLRERAPNVEAVEGPTESWCPSMFAEDLLLGTWERVGSCRIVGSSGCVKLGCLP